MNRKQRRAAAKYGQIASKPSRDAAAKTMTRSAAELLEAGARHHRAGRLVEAEACYRQVLTAHPGYPDAFHLLGIIAAQTERPDLSVELIGEAIKRAKQNPVYFSDLGNALQALERFDEAMASYDKALALKPGYAEAYNNRGNVLRKLLRFDEALASYDMALALRPDYAEAFNNRGNAFYELKRFDEALASYDKALALKPGYARAFSNRGSALDQLKRYDEALASYDKALALDPAFADAFSGAMWCVNKLCDWGRKAALASGVISRVTEHKSPLSPFPLLGYSDDPLLQLQCARNYTADRFPRFPRPLWRGEKWRDDKVRVAYFSADFRQHPMAHLITELIELHDRARFEVIAVSFGADDGTEMRKRLVAAFDRFIDIRGKSDKEAAALVHGLQPDIAIDLMGHTQDSRLGIFAHRPAPIQVSYIGYPGASGAPFIDYIIADETVAPFEHQAFYTEHIVHLPDCYLPNDTKRKIAELTPTRQEAGLPENGFVFCCFNQNWKIAPEVFSVWMRLLHAVEGSVFWLKQENDRAEQNLRREAQARGVDPSRLVFAKFLQPSEHLARHRLVDLFLDTLPYNAHTTASDALWAGVPVVTQIGNSFAGRVAASQLKAIGLPELITRDRVEYEALALKLATDPALLAHYRSRLQANRLTHPLFNTDRFRRHIEAAYIRMRELWQRGEPPQSFSVEADGSLH